MPSCLTRMLASFAKDSATTKADIEACCRIFLFGEDDAKFSESNHPRDKDGKFSKGSSSGGKASGESKHEAPDIPEPPKPEAQPSHAASVVAPASAVYATSAPLGGGKSLLNNPGKQRTMKKSKSPVKKQKASKQEYARLTSHAMQYMTHAQRKDTIVTMQMAGIRYTFEKDEDYTIKRIIRKSKR